MIELKHLTKSRLSPLVKAHNPLIPSKQADYYHNPNPRRERSGAFEVVRDTGPLPGSTPTSTSIFLFVILIMLGLAGVFASAVLFWVSSLLNRLILAAPIIGLAAIILIALPLYFRSRGKREGERIATAWKNGWIEYYPALIGQIYLTRVDRSHTSKIENSKTYYYYKAPLLLLLPDGSTRPVHSYEFELKATPTWYSFRKFNVVDSAEEATVSLYDHENNGWMVVGVNVHKDTNRAELYTELIPAQEQALLNFAEQQWVPKKWYQ
ncbi:hypothetical protein [Rothia nasisuis]|uniref:hypothetical protein n=1 Tax=Rothia nasisuis TaxID=2109647 RepID=UPI001F3A835D|nr:hypothetical protein [Rothia nasisuis]